MSSDAARYSPVQTSVAQLMADGWQPQEWEEPSHSRLERGWSAHCFQRRRRWLHPQRPYAVWEVSEPVFFLGLDGLELVPCTPIGQLDGNTLEAWHVLMEGLEFLGRALDGRSSWDRPEIEALARWVARCMGSPQPELARRLADDPFGKMILEELRRRDLLQAEPVADAS